MEESRFNQLADAMLERLEAALEALNEDFDFEIKPGGVIEIDFGAGGKIIVNRHSAAREIWIAARSGGFHFKPDGNDWLNTRDGLPLIQVLNRCMSEQSGKVIDFTD
jgi:CyaY protein